MSTKMFGLKMSDRDIKKVNHFVDADMALNFSDYVRQAVREKIERSEQELKEQ